MIKPRNQNYDIDLETSDLEGFRARLHTEGTPIDLELERSIANAERWVRKLGYLTDDDVWSVRKYNHEVALKSGRPEAIEFAESKMKELATREVIPVKKFYPDGTFKWVRVTTWKRRK